MQKIKDQDFQVAVDKLLDMGCGTVFQPVAETEDGQTLYLVFGWEEGYDRDENLYQEKEGDTLWTICAKLAFNMSSLQCDFDIDWYMPWNEHTGDVYETCQAVEKNNYNAENHFHADYYNEDVEEIIKQMNAGSLVCK